MLNVFSSRTFIIALMVVLTSSLVGVPSAFAGVALAPSDQNVSARVKSYLEWKTSKVAEVESKIKSLKSQLSSRTAAKASKDPNLMAVQKDNKNKIESGLNPDLQSQLDDELLNLSNTQDLTISDYFVGYLSKQSSVDEAIEEVSSRLSPEEVAQLMKALADQFNPKPTNVVKSPLRADSSQ
ncbi:MAG: hypothetical protein ACXWPX_12035 [Pseudobdellovibrio sp.]